MTLGKIDLLPCPPPINFAHVFVLLKLAVAEDIRNRGLSAIGICMYVCVCMCVCVCQSVSALLSTVPGGNCAEASTGLVQYSLSSCSG